MSLSPEGGRATFLRDLADILMDMDGVERLDLTALGGNDAGHDRRHVRHRRPAG